MALTTEQRAKYDTDGFLVLDPGTPPELVDQINADLEPLWGTDPGVVGVKTSPPGVYFEEAWRLSPAIKTMALAPGIMSALKDFYGRKPLPFQTLNFRRGSQISPHSDTIHFNSMPAGYMCGVWVALEDVDMDNGPLVYYPGSHKLPEYTLKDVGVTSDRDHYPAYEQFIKNMIAERDLKPAYGTIKKGQAIIWASNLVHGGARLTDKSRTRLSQVTHYYFEGCKYYTPMFSTEDKTHWRDPTWIVPDEPLRKSLFKRVVRKLKRAITSG